MTDNRTTELLPCPFCGGEAELKHYQSGDWQVVCYHADGCIMRESDLDNCYWENVQTLARQWNTRAELGRLNATSSQESIVRSFLRKISPNRDWDYLGEHEHALIADLVDDIAATLGSGTLTVEQVIGAFEGHARMAFPRFVPDWQAIADELTAKLGSGTCEVEYVNDWMGWHCKSCDMLWQGLPDQKPSYCMRCGKAVKR